MIIKRRATKQFVQIDNAIVRDRRLELDEHGMLHYLLSLPDDWEINLRQIEKFWKIGRDKRKRIFRNLRKVGWVQLEKIQADNGDFIGARWIVGDEPGPEATDDTIDIEQETDDEHSQATPTPATAAPESQGPAVLASGDGATALASDGFGVGRETRPPQNTSTLRRNTSDEYRDSTNTTWDAARDDLDDGEPPPYFGHLLKLWPADSIASAYTCEKVFSRMSAWQRKLARDGIKPYLADCRSKGQTRLCDLRTYLDERRWEKFTSGRGAIGVTYYSAKRGTPQAMRWREHFERTEPTKLKLFDQIMVSSGAYTVPSEWPPAKGPTTERGNHDPPTNLSEEDSAVVANTF